MASNEEILKSASTVFESELQELKKELCEYKQITNELNEKIDIILDNFVNIIKEFKKVG